MSNPALEAKLLDLRSILMDGSLDSDDKTAITGAIAKQHLSLQFVQDPSQPWTGPNRSPCRALLIVGAFRTGKTFLTQRAIARLKPLPPSIGELPLRPVQVTASPTFNIEQMGRDILGRLLQMPARSLGPSRTMERVHRN